jgi:hypothetical protein
MYLASVLIENIFFIFVCGSGMVVYGLSSIEDFINKKRWSALENMIFFLISVICFVYILSTPLS